jgi:hypothetical protein
MNDIFPCGDHEALVAYLYDDGDRADREAIGAHLAQCVACAEEIAALRATRTQLAAWAPPDARLGFQITSADQRNEPLAFTAVDRTRRSWWREPLPAWAQAAAAALIFAAGLTAGSLGRAPAPNTVATAPAAAPVADRTPQTVTAPVSATDVARLEQRLNALESARVQHVSAPAAVATARGVDEQALLARTQAVIDEQARLSNEVALLADTTRNIGAQYGDLYERVNRTTGVSIEDLQRSRAPGAPFGATRVSFRPVGQ